MNRLKTENNGAGGFIRTYEYNFDGSISRVTEKDNASGEESVSEYTYEQGRLKTFTENGVTESYSYDNCGNPTHYNSNIKNMWWERGNILTKYVKNGQTIEYVNDAEGRLRKVTGSEREYKLYRDGDKLIAMKIRKGNFGGHLLKFNYDIEGIIGFVYNSKCYHYIKDAQENVIGIISDSGITMARYVYDAWGNSKAIDGLGNEITAWNSVAMLNPIRWKSLYYDVNSGFYDIGGRWYDPAHGMYVTAASPETLLQSASVVFALNLYNLVTENPVALMFALSTCMPSLDFYYNGEYKTWWDIAGKWILFGIGVLATVVACVFSGPCGAAASAATIGLTLAKIAMGTAIGTAMSLAIGGTIAGIQSALTGHSFWDAFADYVQENFVDALVTSFATTAITVAMGNLIAGKQCFKEGTLIATEEGLKPIEEIREGDRVLAYDETTGEQGYKPVVQLFRNETNEWYHVFVNGEEIVCTGGHPFYVMNAERSRNTVWYGETKSDGNGKWVQAKDIKVSDQVLLSDGSCAIIEAIEVEKLSASEVTYNFEVADYHTYYVSDSKVLVHNDCVNEALSKAKVDDITIKDKHLNSSGGRWNKFNVNTEAEAKLILKDTIKRGKILSVGNNGGKLGTIGQKSFDVLLDAGKVIGTRGEKSLFIVIDELGNIWTVFPK